MKTRTIPTLPLALAILLALTPLHPASAFNPSFNQSFEWGGGNGFMGSNQRVSVDAFTFFSPDIARTVFARASSRINLCYRTFDLLDAYAGGEYYPHGGSRGPEFIVRGRMSVMGRAITNYANTYREAGSISNFEVGHGVNLVNASVGIGPFSFKLAAGGHCSFQIGGGVDFVPNGPARRPTVRPRAGPVCNVVGWAEGGIDVWIGAGGVKAMVTPLAYLYPTIEDEFYDSGSQILSNYRGSARYRFASINVWAWGRIGPPGFSYNWSDNVVNFSGFGGDTTLVSGNEVIFNLSAAPPARTRFRPTFRKGSSRPTFLTPNYPSILR